MRNRVRIPLAVMLATIAGLIVWQVLREREPVYQGKGLRVWLKEARQEKRQAIQQGKAEAAVRQIGTNAIPTLLDMLRKRDSLLAGKSLNLLKRHPREFARLPAWLRERLFVWLDWNDDGNVKSEAERGFEILGADA
jgi:hypothetical protein